MSILKVENLKKYYTAGETIVKAVDGINLEVKQGQFVSIVGKSGSGKSTFLHLVGGLDAPDSGKIYYNGKEIIGRSQEEITIFRRRKSEGGVVCVYLSKE